jgi:hypothetical protein
VTDEGGRIWIGGEQVGGGTVDDMDDALLRARAHKHSQRIGSFKAKCQITYANVGHHPVHVPVNR